MEPGTGRWLLEPMIQVASELQARSGWTWAHSGRVARYAVAFGKKLGLDPVTMLALHSASILHDVGKMMVPTALLDKVAALTRDEWYTITKHPMASSVILRNQAIALQTAAIAQSHHEWYNGKGYPMGLEGDAIPIGARILSLADAYDAMSSDRPYRPALAPEQILREIEKGAGTQFDPVLVKRLRPLIESELSHAPSGHRLRLITDDPMLVQQFWFAGYPVGWDIEVWPDDWAKLAPNGLLAPGDGPAEIDLTVMDGRSFRRAPDEWRERIKEPFLWVDPPDGESGALLRPLDLESVLARLDAARRTPEGESAIRVLIADPYHLFRQALRRCLEDSEGFEVVAEVDSPSTYRRTRKAVEYDIAIVASDLLAGTHTTAPLKPGDMLLRESEAAPENKRTVPTIVLVADEDLEHEVIGPMVWEPGALVSGKAYIHRGAPVEILVEAIRTLTAEVRAD